MRRLLTFDGGGARGIISATVVDALERKLRVKRLRTKVDRLAGTSVGAIVACAVSLGKSGEECTRLMENLGPTVFPGAARRVWGRLLRLPREGVSAPRYDGRALDRALAEAFPPDMLFGDLPVPVDVPAFDVRRGEMWLFSSDSERDAWLPLVDVVAASASAPTYFPARSMAVGVEGDEAVTLVDGGVGANNPAVVSIMRAVERGADLGELRVVSVGTGAPAERKTSPDLGRGILEWAPSILTTLMGATSDVAGRNAAGLVDGRLERVQVPLPSDRMALDDASPENLRWLRKRALGHLSVGPSVERAAKLLRRR